MNFIDQFRTGLRNLSRQKLRTSLTIFAIVIGAVSVTVMLSLITSTKSFLVSSAEKIGMDTRVIVTGTPGLSYRESQWTWPDGSGKKIDADVLAAIEKLDNVKSATLYINVQMFESYTVDDQELTMKNVNIEGYTPNGSIKHIMVAGSELSDSSDGSGILISSDLASDLGFKGDEGALIGKEISLRYRKDMGPANAPRADEVAKIIGITASDGGSILSVDLNWAVAFQTMPNQQNNQNGQNTQNDQNTQMQNESQIDRNGYSSIWIRVNEKQNVGGVLSEIKQLGFGAAAGKEEIDSQATAFTIIGAILGGIGAIALLVAAIGVINTMVMATLERTREIGIMRAIGATKKTIRRLFRVEAGVLGFTGGLFGVLLSYGFAVGLNQILNRQLADSGITDRNIVSISPQIALAVLFITTMIGMLAGSLPARRAANMDPVEALRYE
ncbi:MAG: ABC transporter permease [Actinomycetes bacterium]